MRRWLICALVLAGACGRTPEPSPRERTPSLVAETPRPSASVETPSASVETPSAVAPDLPGRKPGHGAPGSRIKHVIIIAMENHDAAQIYHDTLNAPYLHSLVERYAHTEKFPHELPLEIPSEGHYVWMEAGTHQFSDALFDDDSPPSASVSTGSNLHLVRQIKNADSALSWMAYQEGINERTGACPIHSSGFYVPKHDPFVFFRDVAGDPPAEDNAYCALHHKPYSSLAADLEGELASYVFITPDECHDMHGQPGCPEENPVRTGDKWLQSELPRLIGYAERHAAVIFITFDEGSSSTELPFIAVGAMVKPNYTGTERYSHSSQLRSVELILGLPPLPSVRSSTALSALFQPGAYP